MKINRAIGAIILLIALKIMFGDVFDALTSSLSQTANTYGALMKKTEEKFE